MTITYDISHICQLDHIHPEVSCGVACLMMLLQYQSFKVKKKIPDYITLSNELQPTKIPSEKGLELYPDSYGAGVYVDDIAMWLLRNEYVFTACNHKNRMTFDALQNLLESVPLMVGMAWYKVGHWVVLKGIENNFLSIADPIRKVSAPPRRRIRREIFYSDWDGSFVALPTPGPKITDGFQSININRPTHDL